MRWWVGDNDGQSIHQYKYQVFIRRVHPDASLVLSHEEIASILYDHLQFPVGSIKSCCQVDKRVLDITSMVEMDPSVRIAGYEVRPGELCTEDTQEAREQKTVWVHVYGMHTDEDDTKLEELLVPFGEIATAVQRFLPRNPDRGRMNGVWLGARRVGMVLRHHIPNTGFIKRGDFEDKINIQYAGQVGDEVAGEDARSQCWSVCLSARIRLVLSL